jgi:hypothetical protein
MTTAFTISIIAAINIQNNKLDFFIGVILLTIAFGLYQPSVNAFIGTSALLISAELFNNNTFSRNIVCINIAKFVVASLLYKIAILAFPLQDGYALEHSQIIIPTTTEAFLIFIGNIGKAGVRVMEFFSDVPLLSIIGIVSIALFGARVTCKGIDHNNKILNFAAFVACALALTFSIFGILLFLQNPVLSPRTFIGFAIFLVYMLFCFKAALGSFTGAAAIFLFFPIYYLYFLAFAYGAAAKSQTEYDYQLGASIMQNLNSLGFQPESTLIFDGIQPRSPVLENSKHIKIIDRLVKLHINNQWAWGYRFMQHQGLEFTRSTSGNVHNEIAQICKREPVLIEQRYKIYKFNRTFVIGFQNGGCFQKTL